MEGWKKHLFAEAQQGRNIEEVLSFAELGQSRRCWLTLRIAEKAGQLINIAMAVSLAHPTNPIFASLVFSENRLSGLLLKMIDINSTISKAAKWGQA